MAELTPSRHQEGSRQALHQHQHYVQPRNGLLAPVVVQSLDDPRNLPHTSQWTRMGPPASRVASLLKVAFWIGSSTLKEGTSERTYTPRAIAEVAFKAILASPLSYCLISGLDWGIPLFDRKTVRNVELDLRYDGVFSRDPMSDQASLPQTETMAREDRMSAGRRPCLNNIRLNSHLTPRRMSPDRAPSWVSRNTAHSLRPRYLCFVKDFEQKTYETVQVSDYLEQQGEHVDAEFIFVSYTRMQFRVATDEEIDAYSYPDEATRQANRRIAREDRETLVRWAIDAAAAAGKPAFWLDFECVRDSDGKARSTSNSEDVYRICDIVRASHSMIIGIGPPADERIAALLNGESPPERALENQTKWLRQWGSRLWTLPELLLCPSEYRIKLFVTGDSDEPRELAKRNFAERAWDDADSVKDLVNHYEGSAILSPLLLIATALECFSRRKTDQFSPGDIAYAIMGLLPDRQRPQVNQADSGFQAFARLSLAHDDGRFLERLICLLPARKQAKWFETDDLWGARLRDVLPCCQVVGTGDGNSIVLDGAHGATISWDEIDGGFGLNLINDVARSILVAGVGFTVLVPKITLFTIMFWIEWNRRHGSTPPLKLLNVMLVFSLFIPVVYAFIGPLLPLCRSEEVKKPPKARLIGLEGFADTATIERYLWGHNFGRLTQMSNIPLYHDETGETVEEQSQQGEYAFTLVDTYALTVTHFRASRPPVALFVCGQEGGMQRALLCSYDASMDTYCRETVVKVHNKVLEQMRRADKFRFALEYPEQDGVGEPEDSAMDEITLNSKEVDGATEKVLDDGVRSWKLEWSFFVVTMLAIRIYRSLDYYDNVKVHTYMIKRPDNKWDADWDADKRPDGDKLLFLYGIAFTIAQVPTHYLLSRVSITRIVPSLAFIKGILVSITDPRLRWYNIRASAICIIMEGFTDSVFLAILVIFAFSWFTISKVPTRMLIWTCGLIVFNGTWQALSRYIVPMRVFIDDDAAMNYTLFCFYLTLKGSQIITTPNECPWLDAHKRVLYQRRAAAYLWDSPRDDSGKHSWNWLPPSPQPALFFVANILNATTMLPALDASWWSLTGAGVAIGMLLVPCILLRRAPQATSLVIITGLLIAMGASIFMQAGRATAEEKYTAMLLQTQNFITPLLWALIPSTTSTRSEGRWSLTFSLVGWGAGKALSIIKLTVVSTLPMMVSEIFTVGFIWLIQRRRESKAARFLRARAIGEEYHDDIE